MPIFRCASCGSERQVSEEDASKQVNCPQCPAEERMHPVEKESELSAKDVRDAVLTTDSVPDIICPACGTVHTQKHHAQKCQKCGSALLAVFESADDVTEEHIGVDDMAEHGAEEQIWEAASSLEEKRVGGMVSQPVEASLLKKQVSLFSGGILHNVYAGCVVGLVGFFFAISLGLLVSSQAPLAGFFPLLVNLALVSSVIVGIIIALKSRIPFAIGAPDAVLSALLFLFVGSIYRTMEGGQSADTIMPTLFVAVGLATFSTGFGLWVMSALGAGRWVRYIPSQVLGGVYGAVGAIVILGAFNAITGSASPTSNQFVFIGSLLHIGASSSFNIAWLPSIAYGLLLFTILYRVKNVLVLLTLLIAGVGAGHVAPLLGVPYVGSMIFADVPLPKGGIEYLLSLADPSLFSRVDWSAIAQHNLYIGAFVALTLLRMMVRSTRVEALCDIRVDLDKEYGAVGGASMLAGLAGGMPASISYGRTMGNYALGARGAFSGIIASLVCLGIFIYSDHALALVPRFVAEGFLFYLGLGLMKGWLVDTSTAFTRRDDRRLAFVVFLISLVFGMLIGIGIGVAAALLLTVSRMGGSAVKNELSGAYYRSHVERAPLQMRLLQDCGDHTYIVRLKGFVYLGTMYDLLERIRSRLNTLDSLAVQHVIIDFSLVSGFASATNLGFSMLRDLGLEEEINIIFTNAPLELADHLEKSGYVLNDVEGSFKLFMNLEFALEWCEGQILDGETHGDVTAQLLPELLKPAFPDPRYLPLLMKVLKRVEADKGEILIEQGDFSDTMYFVESGSLNVLINSHGDKPERVKKIAAGATFGEMGFYTESSRSATVQADEKCVLYRLDRKVMARIEKRVPALATMFNRYLITILSERLVTANAKALKLR